MKDDGSSYTVLLGCMVCVLVSDFDRLTGEENITFSARLSKIALGYKLTPMFKKNVTSEEKTKSNLHHRALLCQ